MPFMSPLIDALPLMSVRPAVIDPFLGAQGGCPAGTGSDAPVVPSTRALPPTPRSPLTHSAHGASLANAGKRSTVAWIRRWDFVLVSATELVGVHPVDVICRWCGLATGSGVVMLTR